MTFVKQVFEKYIKNLNNNDFIYKNKIAYFLLSDREQKLYEQGFISGYELAKTKISNKIDKLRDTHIIPLSTERKIIGYQFRKPKKVEIDSVINKVCVKYEVSKVELFSKVRTKDIVRARNIIHNIFNEKYKMSLTDIGKIFNQDHTTVLNSIQMKQKREYYWYDNQTIWQEFDELTKS